jgi:hypothetical protein
MSQQLQPLTVIEIQAPDQVYVRRYNLCSKCRHERTHHIEGTCRDCGCYARRKANTVKHAVRVLQDLEDLE